MKKRYSVILIIMIITNLNAQDDQIMTTCASQECHASLLSKSYIHPPLEDGCEICHDSNGQLHPNNNGAEFTLTANVSELCGTCHETEATKKVSHSPFIDGECVSCHTPHSSDISPLIKGKNQREVCIDCHDLDKPENKFGHGPFMSNQCVSCHLGHQSDFAHLAVDEDPFLCFQCHQGKEEDLELSNIHPVFRQGCLNCHSPHMSPARNLLLTESNELCYECHKNVKSEVTTSKIIHDPLTKEGMCVSCHSPHAGELTKLLVTEQPNLCFNCHSENINNKEKFIDIYARMSKEFVHKPIFEGICTDCHLPHVSMNYNLLTAAFPKGNYSKPEIENYSMCFQCHDSNKITSKITTETGFRDGSKNLHSVHVMKKKSISCQSCHDMHGADNEHIIGNVVYFGKWEMPIGFEVTETGGTCLPGCHIQYSYNRNK